ncbi:Cu(I)-responsive transcriptional regulator [Mesorhizobium sp. B2-6-2]|uniref:Cu(I)-responsive transcriptional regulator n=1 Tax=Mesorhizobium sp. B2-6-2 TaxID=2589915 RepID=UPI001128FE54|nr:Cu(I)-responsive transcriptional regulator [Mesorhizobium sp. B2-6-2]TPJ77153.1 Cu(I)-responsive transcriptional regulator [Mesorhizobium sp. B2-6-2]
MNIGEAAKASGVSAKMIRYYESTGLIRSAHRTESNYRIYGEDEVHVLRFIKRSRNLGFSLEETSVLLGLWRDKGRASADVKRIASSHIGELQNKIAAMQEMVETLKHLVSCCSGDERPNCPILNDLAKAPRKAAVASRKGNGLADAQRVNSCSLPRDADNALGVKNGSA